ncbi:MAG: TlyA family RNA methyltransferase [Vulcanibacillus sp.]
MLKKERLDVLIVEKGIISSREQAKRMIMAGLVKVNNEVIDKPGTKVLIDADIILKESLHPYVSRGGLKLMKAIDTFSINLEDKIMIDIGASTGGFTDCALQHGAKEVYAIDVGYGQLAWKIRQDERVHVMERTNFRYVTKEEFKHGKPNFVTIDVSFISLKTILANLINIIDIDSEIVALVKPQFEAGKDKVGKKGLIKDQSIHKEVLKSVVNFAINISYEVLDITFSPIKGGEGNIEFLMYLKVYNSEKTIDNYQEIINFVVEQAHQL